MKPALEEVTVEKVQLLDYIYVGPGKLACVIAKASARLGGKVAGWRLELIGGDSIWYSRGARVQRCPDLAPALAAG